jgi:MFS transporter, DHA3 family, macrolide efflux protein
MIKPTRLLNRHFALLWQGQFASQIGNQLHATAVMFWIKHATGSASLMGLIMMFSTLPGVILGPLGGTFADRYSRRAIIILSDLICGIAVLLLAGLLFLRPGATGPVVFWLFVVSVLIGIVGAFFRPAISAAVPDLVPRERIAAANSLTQSSMQVSVFVGQGLGGTLFRLLGAPTLFLANGISYVFSATLATFIRIPQHPPRTGPPPATILKAFAADTAVGLRYVWHRRGMRNLFLTAAVLNFLTSPFGVRGRSRAALVIGCLVLAGATLALFGVVRHRFGALGLSLGVGLLTGIININLMTILQQTTPSEIRGRVFGLLGTLAMGLTPIGMGLAGMTADLLHHSITSIFIACGSLMAAVTLLVATDRDFRTYLSYEEASHAGA